MFSGRGLPNERDVKAVLTWPVWQMSGKFNHGLFRSISSMFSGRGLPKERDVTACMEWLSEAGGANSETLQLMSRLFCGAFAGHKALGLPPTGLLRDYEQRLSRLVKASASKDNQYTCEIKQIALFLANRGGTSYLSWPECERFFSVCSGSLNTEDTEPVFASTAQALARLHSVLLAQGGPGVRAFLAINEQQGWVSSAHERGQQLILLSMPVALEALCRAFDLVPAASWRDYIYFGRKGTTPPDASLWHEICDWRHVLPERMSNLGSQRDFIAMAVTLPDHCKKRLMTRAAVEAVITLFPSVHILRELAHHTPPANLAELFCAALDYVQKEQYNGATLTTLLPALLQSGLTLPSTAPTALPHHTFMNTEACDGGFTIHCPADVADGEKLLHLFAATVTTIACDMFTTTSGEHFTVKKYGGELCRFALPKCVTGPHSFTISNWSPEDFKLFFDVTEHSEFYLTRITYQDGQKPYDCNRQQRMGMALAASADNSGPFTALSLSTLYLFIKNNAPMDRLVWLSFAHHRYRLPQTVCQRLLPLALGAINDVTADFLDWLQSRCPAQQIAQPHAPAAARPLATSAQKSFEQLWAALANKQLLDGADLAVLNHYHDQLSLAQLASVVGRASLALPDDALKIWCARLTEARHQISHRAPRLLDIDDDFYELIMDA